MFDTQSSLTYTFANGDEGSAEGVIKYRSQSGESVICFGNSDGALKGYAPLAKGSGEIAVAMRYGTLLPFDADRVIAYEGGEIAAQAPIDASKRLNTGKAKAKFASVSDIHMNYAQGREMWIHALDAFESDGVEYVLVSGDVGEKGEHYLIYDEACKQSNFTGLIFSCIGNHDQTDDCREMFLRYAIYDGGAKTFVPLESAKQYFEREYKGSLSVSVTYEDREGGGRTYYYSATVGDSLCIFMDQMLKTGSGNTAREDNFSPAQLDFVTEQIKEHYADYDIYICEHAPITELGVGFDPEHRYYGACIEIKPEYPNNTRFRALLGEYTRCVWMSGHTHISFGLAVCYGDREVGGTKPVAHCIHNGSTAQTRELDGGVIAYGTDYRSASQAYVCYKYDGAALFEGHILKYRTPSPELDTADFCDVIDPTTTFYFRY